MAPFINNTMIASPHSKQTMFFFIGMAHSCAVPLKCFGGFLLAELRRLVLERGRSLGTLQTEQGASIRCLVRGLASYAGPSVRQVPAYSHESQGSIERYRSTLPRVTHTKEEDWECLCGKAPPTAHHLTFECERRPANAPETPTKDL